MVFSAVLTLSPDSERIVVDLDPIPVGVLQIHLFYLIRAHLRLFTAARPVAVLNLVFVQVLGKRIHGGDAKGQMYIDVVGDHLFGAGNHMQLAMVGHLEPDMFVVMEGFGYFLQTQDIFIEAGAFIQVYHKNGGMAQMDALRAGRKGYQDGSGQYKEIASK